MRAPRFTSFAPPAGEPSRLIVTVDTEEAFDWSDLSAGCGDAHSPEPIKPFQAICEKHGAKPLYFLTYPMLDDARPAEYFRKLSDEGRADFGLHHHPWVTPPIRETDQGEHSYHCNLPADVRQAKLAAMADKFEAVMGFRARAHRAGRYGLSTDTFAELAAVGVQFDFSPSAGFDLSGDGGPDFSGMSSHPFRVATKPEIICVPASGARAVRRTNMFVGQSKTATAAFKRQPRIPNDLTAPMRLTPEATDLASLTALTRRLIRMDVPVMSYSLHSTSLIPGANPYSAQPDGVARILATTEAFFETFATLPGAAFGDLDWLASAAFAQPSRLQA